MNKHILRKFKENYESTKDYLAITKKYRMENNLDRDGKINQALTHIPTKNINELIYALIN